MAIIGMIGFEHYPGGTVDGLRNDSEFITGILTYAPTIISGKLAISRSTSRGQGIGLSLTIPAKYINDTDRLVIGFRYEKLSDSGSGEPALFQNSTSTGLNVANLQLGEYFIEAVYTRDLVYYYIDGLLTNTTTTNTLGSGVEHYLQLGVFRTGGTTSSSSAGDHRISDIYILTNTNDDTPCDRLGSVKVKAVTVDEVIKPDDWNYTPRMLGSRHLLSIDSRGSLPTRGDPARTGTFTIAQNGQFSLSLRKGVIATHFAAGLGFSSGSSFSRIVKIFIERQDGEGVYRTIQEWDVTAYSSDVNRTFQFDEKFISDGTERLRVTLSGSGTGRFRYYQPLGSPEDLIHNMDIINNDFTSRPLHHNEVEDDYNTINTSTSESKAEFHLETPDLGNDEVIALQLTAAARREKGSEEYLQLQTKQNDLTDDLVNLPVQTGYGYDLPYKVYHRDLKGDEFTAESIGDVSVLINSKTGGMTP